MTWNRDLSHTPLDAPVILASKCGKVIKSYWIHPTKREHVGRWAGFKADERVIAWQLWPVHPGVEA